MLKLRIFCSRWNNSHLKIHTILLSLLNSFPSHKSLNAPSAINSFGKVHFLLTIRCQGSFHFLPASFSFQLPQNLGPKTTLLSHLQKASAVLTSIKAYLNFIFCPFFVTSFHFISIHFIFLDLCLFFTRNSFSLITLWHFSLVDMFFYLHFLILVKFILKINEWQIKIHLLFFSYSYFDLPFDLKYSSGASKIRLKVATKCLHFPPSTYLWSTTKFTIAVFPTITFPSSITGSSWTAFNAAKTVHPVNPEF